MINTKMFGDKWRLEISGEVWEFDNVADLKETFGILLNFKSDFGRLKKGGDKYDRCVNGKVVKSKSGQKA